VRSGCGSGVAGASAIVPVPAKVAGTLRVPPAVFDLL